jgi:hypothetical protein
LSFKSTSTRGSNKPYISFTKVSIDFIINNGEILVQ